MLSSTQMSSEHLKTTPSSVFDKAVNDNQILDESYVDHDHYVDMSCSNFGIEGLNLDPILEIEAFDFSEYNCQMAAGDWVLNDNMADALWNMGEM